VFQDIFNRSWEKKKNQHVADPDSIVSLFFKTVNHNFIICNKGCKEIAPDG
jgi:hypothetical protein